MEQRSETRDLGGNVLVVAAVLGIAYYLLALAMWEIDTTWGSAFWPAAGLSFAVLTRTPTRWWPLLLAAVATAELTANLQHDTSVATAIWGAVANSAEPLVGAGLFRLVCGRRTLVDLRSLGWFVAAGAMAGPAVGALFGGLLASSGPAAAPTRWVRWALGDGVGVFVVAPVLLAGGFGVLRRRAAELLALAAGLAVSAALLVLATGSLGDIGPYLAVPLLMWAALRFGLLGGALASTAVASVVHVATATGHGAFATEASSDLIVAQSFIAAVSVATLTVAVLVDDVARRRAVEQDLLHRALHDPLTGLPNRSMLDLTLAEGPPGAVLVIDLDGFKSVNDLLGHAAGDQALQEVARRLRSVCRADDLLARVGGDEFVIVLSGSVDDDRIAGLATRVEAAVGEPIELPGGTVRIGASVGAAPGHLGGEPGSLVIEADRRMYAAKQHRRRHLEGDPTTR